MFQQHKDAEVSTTRFVWGWLCVQFATWLFVCKFAATPLQIYLAKEIRDQDWRGANKIVCRLKMPKPKHLVRTFSTILNKFIDTQKSVNRSEFLRISATDTVQ